MTPDELKRHEKELIKSVKEYDEKDLPGQFNEYVRFLKAEGAAIPTDQKELDTEYLNFIFWARIHRKTQLANQTRWLAILRAGDELGFDVNSEDGREHMLGVLAYSAFPAEVPKIEKRKGRPKGAIKWTKDRIEGYERDVLEVSPSKRPRDWGLIARKLSNNPKYKGFKPDTYKRYWRDKVEAYRDK